MVNEKKIIVGIFCAIIFIALIFYSQSKSSAESFVTTDQMYFPNAENYDLIDHTPTEPVLNAPDFADLVDSGDHALQPIDRSDLQRPLERLQTLSDSYMPRVASRVLPFSHAAAKPLVHSFSANPPRINLKGKLYEMSLSEAVQGSVPINYDPNIPLIAKSRHGPEDSYNLGLFSGHGSMHNKLTGSFRNMPIYTAGSGQAAGSGGNRVDLIMDM